MKVERRATRHGLGAARPSRLSVLSDFLLFCKLASARGIAPAGSWAWDATLDAAGYMLDEVRVRVRAWWLGIAL